MALTQIETGIIADGAVTADKIAANTVTPAKMSRTGTAGQVLTSGGAGADPSYTTINTSISVDIQTFNAGDADLTWEKPTGGQTMVKIEVWAGGGGGARNSSAGSVGGGGGGAYNEWTGPISYMGATAAVTVGAAGVGRTASSGNGTGGGNSSIAIASYPNGSKTIIAYGGGGGTTTTIGGGGGGLLSAGQTGVSGLGGLGYELISNATINNIEQPVTTAGGSGYAPGCSTRFAWGSVQGGGGGGSGATGIFGGRSMYGGGGGSFNSAGVSLWGGNGGANAVGVTPAGGGGVSGTANTNGSNGGAGRVVITSW